MKHLPDISTDWLALSGIITDGARHKIFIAALRLKIFDHLDGSASEEIAARMETHPRNTELLLNALAGMDLIRKKNGEYGHTEQSAAFLDSGSAAYLGDYLLHVNAFYEQAPEALENLVRTGPPPATGDLSDQSVWAESAKRHAAYQYCGEARRIADILGRLPEFPEMRRMLELGGGAGFYTMTIVAGRPDMTGVILEQPAVAEVTKGFVREYGLEDRVEVIAGDYMRDDLQGPYDLIYASATLNFYKHDLDQLFTKVHAALAPGGVFMTHQDGIREERTRPGEHVVGFLFSELMGGDFSIAQGEIAEAMLAAGFQSVRSFTKRSNIGEMDVDIGRKARSKS